MRGGGFIPTREADESESDYYERALRQAILLSELEDHGLASPKDRVALARPDHAWLSERLSAAMRWVRVIEFHPYSIKERAACVATKPLWKSDYGGNFGDDNSLDSNFDANI